MCSRKGLDEREGADMYRPTESVRTGSVGEGGETKVMYEGEGLKKLRADQ